MVWENLEKKRASAAAAEGGMFMRLADDGDHALVAFIGEEPTIHYLVWTGEGYEEYDAEAHGPRGTAKPSMRAAIAVLDLVDGKVKIWDMPKSGQQSALAAVKKFSPDKWAFEITRAGAKGSTDTKYNVLPDHEMGARELAAVKAAVQPDMEAALGLGSAEPKTANPPAIELASGDRIPF